MERPENLYDLVLPNGIKLGDARIQDLQHVIEYCRKRQKYHSKMAKALQELNDKGETVGYRDADGTCYCLDHVPELVRAEAEIRRDMRITRQTVDESSEVIMCKTGYHPIV